MTKELLKQALDALELAFNCEVAFGAHHNDVVDTVLALREALAQPTYSLDTLDNIGYQGRESRPEELAQPNPWRDAIDDELVCLHLGTADSFPTAKFALDLLISWHVQVALDPEVSAAAQALIDRGAAQPQAEPVYQFRRVGCADWYDGHPDCEDGRGPYQIRKLYAVPQAAVAEPLNDWEFVAMWATAAEKHDDKYNVAVEFGRAVEQAHGIKGSKT